MGKQIPTIKIAKTKDGIVNRHYNDEFLKLSDDDRQIFLDEAIRQLQSDLLSEQYPGGL